MEDSSDHTVLTGKKVLWLLKQSGTDTYQADYYKRVQNANKTDEIKKLINKTPNQVPEDTARKLADRQH